MGDSSRVIIRLVKSRPELYDHSSTYSKTECKKIWRDLAKSIQVSESDLKAKWNSLRNCYTRSVRLQKQNPNKHSTWYLENEMSFLKNHLQRRGRTSSVCVDSDDDSGLTKSENYHDDSNQVQSPILSNSIKKEYQEDEGTQFESLDNIFGQATKPEIILQIPQTSSIEKLAPKPRKPKFKRRKMTSSFILNKVNKLEESLTSFLTNATKEFELSSDDLFFQSIQKDFEKLSNKSQRKFKLLALNSINNLLDDVE